MHWLSSLTWNCCGVCVGDVPGRRFRCKRQPTHVFWQKERWCFHLLSSSFEKRRGRSQSTSAEKKDLKKLNCWFLTTAPSGCEALPQKLAGGNECGNLVFPRRRKMRNIQEIYKQWSYSHTLISGPLRSSWTPTGRRAYCSSVSLYHCVSLAPPQNTQRPLYFLATRPDPSLALICLVFHISWNVKCATCRHCAWMINTSVDNNYNRETPKPPVPRWCWWKMVWMFVCFSVHLCLSFNDTFVF